MYLHAHLDILGGFHRIIFINSKLSETLSTFLKSTISPPSKSLFFPLELISGT
ncbi:hypothetical protein Hanom_Chr06g00538511 [Helianthus anomalus]